MKKRKKLFGFTFVVLVLISLSVAGIGTATGRSWFGEDEDEGTKRDRASSPFTFDTFRKIAEQENPTVVNIQTTKIITSRGMNPFEDFFQDDFFRRFFGPAPNQEREFKSQSLGSGVIINEDGYILTNNHVIEGVDEITITLHNEKEYKAEIIGADSMTDLALIKASEKLSDFKVAELGNSDKLQVGDWVMAIGNPFGYGHTITVGVVSAKGRVLGQLSRYADFIQTDASINPGNSGGPLFNIYGEVVGINTAIASGGIAQSAGIGFAIPINMAKGIIDQLKSTGEVVRGWLGVYIQDMTEDLAKSMDFDVSYGALISDVEPDSPAEKAGLEKGDLIIEVEGEKVEDARDLSWIVANIPPETEIKIDIIREGKEKTIKAELGQRIEDGTGKAVTKEEVRLGMTVQPITPELKNYFNLTEDEGVLVSEVKPGGPADEAGIQRGDVILEINRERVESMSDYRNSLRDIEAGDSVVLYIRRGTAGLYVALRAESDE